MNIFIEGTAVVSRMRCADSTVITARFAVADADEAGGGGNSGNRGGGKGGGIGGNEDRTRFIANDNKNATNAMTSV